MSQFNFLDAFGRDQLVDKPAPLSRPSDPQSSKAGEQHIRPKLSAKKQEFLRRLDKRISPSTANEVAQGDESIRKRAKELVEDGIIERIGYKHCSVTHQMAGAYARVTPERKGWPANA